MQVLKKENIRKVVAGVAPLRFIDLFAGIGGFHHAAKSFGMECVFTSEIDPLCKEVYEKNFGSAVQGDVTTIDASAIAKHDIPICYTRNISIINGRLQ